MPAVGTPTPLVTSTCWFFAGWLVEVPRIIRQTPASARLHLYGDRESTDYADVEPNLLVGSLQQLRTDDAKLIRNLSAGTEEYYDLKADPGEQNNLIYEARERNDVVEMRRTLNSKLLDGRQMLQPFSKEEAEQVKDRMRRLGYLV